MQTASEQHLQHAIKYTYTYSAEMYVLSFLPSFGVNSSLCCDRE